MNAPLPAAASPQANVQVKTTTCYMCACRCGIRVHLVDGKIRYIDGNPAHPLNRGVICAKGSSGIVKQFSPARLTKPLMRMPGAERGAGPRGFPGRLGRSAHGHCARHPGRVARA